MFKITADGRHPGRLSILCLLAACLILWLPGKGLCAGAYVYMKGKANAMYIDQFKIKYVKDPRPSTQVVAALPREYKYLKYDFSQVLKMEFLEVAGEERSSPVFLIRLHLHRKGASRKTYLLPVTEFRGVKLGAPWVFPMDDNRGHADNAYKIREIHFASPKR